MKILRRTALAAALLALVAAALTACGKKAPVAPPAPAPLSP